MFTLKKLSKDGSVNMFKIQLIYFFIYLFNFFYNYLPFFYFKRALLVLAGAKLGKFSTIHTPVKFFNLTRKLTVGDNVTINPDCYLDDRGTIYIGNNVNISHSVRIYTAGHDISSPMMSYFERSVKILDDVWVFPNVLIMPGVELSEGCIVLPGSVITKSFPKNSILGGNPACKIGDRKSDAHYKLDHSYWFIN